MYTIKRAPKIRETLRLEDGEKTLEVKVDLDANDAVDHYWRYYEKLCAAKTALDGDTKGVEEITEERFGNAFMALLNFILGEAQAESVVEFYDGNYAELLVDLLPFLFGVVLPKLKDASKRRAEEIAKTRK